MGHEWVTCGSNTYGSNESHDGLQMDRMGLRWVTIGSYMSHTVVTLSNTTFLIFSKLTNLWPRNNFNVIFDQSEEINPVVSLTTILCRVPSWFFTHQWDNSLCLAVNCWVGGEEEWVAPIWRMGTKRVFSEAPQTSCMLLNGKLVTPPPNYSYL